MTTDRTKVLGSKDARGELFDYFEVVFAIFAVNLAFSQGGKRVVDIQTKFLPYGGLKKATECG